jgi:ABC-type antimicrobial peptide transport system permease subunit
MNVALRTILPPAALSETLRSAVPGRSGGPDRGSATWTPCSQSRSRRPRLLAQLLGAFAGLALLLAAVGTYGVLSCMVTGRRREVGIRMALGAARASVMTMVLKQGLQVTIIGIIVGLAGAVGASRLIASLLFGVRPTDPTTLATCQPDDPSWRPSHAGCPPGGVAVDPNVVLRAD